MAPDFDPKHDFALFGQPFVAPPGTIVKELAVERRGNLFHMKLNVGVPWLPGKVIRASGKTFEAAADALVEKLKSHFDVKG